MSRKMKKRIGRIFLYLAVLVIVVLALVREILRSRKQPRTSVSRPADLGRVAELESELDALRPPRIVEFSEMESDEPPYDELLRCLENDWHISASWDGLRKFWNVADAELDEYGQTHMPLPVDADGVPCRVGDKMKYADGTEFEVDGIGSGGTLFSVDDASNSAWWTNAEDKRHAPERTVEDVLSEFASRVLNSGHQWGLDAHDVVAEYAAEIRELKEVDE